ncbi:unnamed protein product [Paramecium sonneborni]|uniref:Uncharacterized protein n=1 Tax=Paramecium sonneborni TaxID=65129 RepID=A0A8S1NJQ3_9CILI|nr:unnamed protein product [Paramecium sonneborni]
MPLVLQRSHCSQRAPICPETQDLSPGSQPPSQFFGSCYIYKLSNKMIVIRSLKTQSIQFQFHLYNCSFRHFLSLNISLKIYHTVCIHQQFNLETLLIDIEKFKYLPTIYSQRFVVEFKKVDPYYKLGLTQHCTELKFQGPNPKNSLDSSI